MKFLESFIDRPLPVYLATVVIVLLGFWSLSELPVKRAPTVEIPFSVVYVPYIGASPDNIESEISIDLDEQLSTLDDLRHFSTVASDGVSTHILEFEDRTDMTESLRSVRDEAELARVDFPDDSDAPIVQELSMDDLPIIFFTLSGGGDLFRLREIAEDLVPRLETVGGVRQVDVFGGLEREVHILADPQELALHSLTQADLAAALGRQSRSHPAGELRGATQTRLIRTTGEYRTLEELRATVIKEGPAGPLELRDLAEVRLGHVRRTSGAWLDGEPSVTLIVRRRPDINTMATVRELEAIVEELRAELPPGMRIDATSDASRVIADMIEQLGTSAAFGFALVIVVLFTMFGFRRALLVGSVLPISLLSTFIGLRLFDMEISNISLFSLILVLGLVVDGAIIVGEAIYAEVETGTRPRDAAKLGISTVGIPVVSAHLTTVAAFAPMLLMIGVMGQFMSVMPKVVCFALIGSLFVDHLLLPAVAARLAPRPAAERKRLAPDGLPWVSPELPRIRQLYAHWLDRALRHRPLILASAFVAFLGAVVVYAGGFVDSIFLPPTDRARFTVNYTLPRGTPLEETNRVGHLIASHVAKLPELDRWVLTTGDTGALSTDGKEGGQQGPEYGRVTVELVPAWERTRGQSEIVNALRTEIDRYAGVEVDMDELTEGPATGAALAIRVKGDRMEDIVVAARDVEQTVAALDGATDVRVDYDQSRPEIRVALDRSRATSRHDVSPDAVANALLTAFHGLEVGRMWIDDERVDLRLRAPDDLAPTIDDVGELPLRTRDGSLTPLASVANIELDFGQNAVFRHDGTRTITVRADSLSGASSVMLEDAAKIALAELPLAGGVWLEFGGETEERDRSYASLWNALKWGLLLIYLIIAIQFNSLVQPLIVLLTVPLAIVGVTLGLLVTSTPFSFMVFIGIVSLTGIVVNDGIVMVDAINRRRRAGMPIPQALRVASAERLRPVLLTTITTIAGLLPLTLGVASGGEFWVPLGIAIISGLMVASGLTLYVVPVLYSVMQRESRVVARATPPGATVRS